MSIYDAVRKEYPTDGKLETSWSYGLQTVRASDHSVLFIVFSQGYFSSSTQSMKAFFGIHLFMEL
jgi:asparagine N-glycosylation enzyme membrane subunit Stt3